MGNKLCDSGKSNKASEYYAEEDPRDYNPCETYIKLGDKLYSQAKTEQNESLLKEAFDKYDKAAKLELGVNWPLVAWGEALYDIAKIKQDESSFEKALYKYNEARDVEWNEFISIKQGIILANLAEIKQNKNLDKEAREDLKKAKKNFKETGKSILEIFAYFDKEEEVEAELIIKTGVLYPLLNSSTEDGKFFNEATKNISRKKLKKYKEIYIRSVFIISKLRMNREYETSVAHYTKKTTAKELLFNKLEFRLYAINDSNDPTEGKTLLDYLFKNKYSEEEKSDTEYRAFAGCFTFKLDNLSQFRLYGKDQNQEGTGLSLVFREDFFCKGSKMPTEKDGKKERWLIDYVSGIKDEKYTLFRCIYIDPRERQVKTVGQSEITDEKYKEYIDGVFHTVNEKMEKLRDLITQNPDLSKNVIEQLLINLRYLTKHTAFKEEQECRIVRICSINEGKIEFNEDKMYIEYESDVIPQIEKIYFGPKATNMESFQDRLTVELKCKIKCEKSTNPLA